MQSVDGVVQVSNVDINIDGQARDEELIGLSDLNCPVLDGIYFQTEHRRVEDFPIRIFVGSIPYEVDFGIMLRAFRMLQLAAKQRHMQSFQYKPDPLVSDVSRKELLDYYSIQHTLPECYGVGEYGLPQSQTRGTIQQQVAQRAYVKQLKGFLMLIEQVMVDYLSQLGHVAQVLSLESDINKPHTPEPITKYVPRLDTFLGGKVQNYEQILPYLSGNIHDQLDRKSASWTI